MIVIGTGQVRILGASNRPLLDKMIQFLAKQEEEVRAVCAGCALGGAGRAPDAL